MTCRGRAPSLATAIAMARCPCVQPRRSLNRGVIRVAAVFSRPARRPARRLPSASGLGCDHEGGPVLDGDRELRREAVPGGQCKPGSRAGAPPIVTAWSVCGPPGAGVRRRPGWSFYVGRRILLCRCRDRPCLGAAVLGRGQ
jgi:hypothetical protein